jgi:hypothetical protein
MDVILVTGCPQFVVNPNSTPQIGTRRLIRARSASRYFFADPLESLDASLALAAAVS